LLTGCLTLLGIVEQVKIPQVGVVGMLKPRHPVGRIREPHRVSPGGTTHTPFK